MYFQTSVVTIVLPLLRLIICQINYQYNPMMTLLHLAVYISTLLKNFYYLQKFLNKQIQLRHEPTRISSSSSTLIDSILVNNYDIVRDSYVLPNFCSDHCPSIIDIDFSVNFLSLTFDKNV
jgi:hypothetical protein